MTIEEAIRHCEEVMMENLEKTKDRNASDPIAISCGECADNHRQLAKWLKELKRHREAWMKVTGIISKWKDSVGGVVVAKDAFSDILDLINDFRPKEGDAE